MGSDPQISEWGNPARKGHSLAEYIGQMERTR